MNFIKTALMGFAQTEITPSHPVETIGFGRKDNRSRGIRDPLMAQVTVWEQDSRRFALIAVDHIGFAVSNADLLREKAAALLSASKEQVMLCFSHTHAAPNDSVETDYLDYAVAKILNAVFQAQRQMKPVFAAWGNADVKIGVNRRGNAGALDKRAGILKVTDENGKLKLLLLRLTAHANVLKSDNYLLSSDYFGAVRRLLEQRYHCPVMVTQGAAGNVAPRYYSAGFTPVDAQGDSFVRSQNALEHMAQEVQLGVEKVIPDLVPQKITKLRLYSIHKRFDADVPEINRAEELVWEAKRCAGIEGEDWLNEVKRLLKAGIHRQWEDVEIQYFVLNEGCLCGVPNELMCEFALETSKRLRDPYFYLGGYTNGCTGYWPTKEEYDIGGYEVFWSMLHYYSYYGRVFPLNRENGEKLVQAVCENAPGAKREMQA